MYTDTVSSFKVFNLDIIPSLNIECLYDFDFIDRSVNIAQILFLFKILVCTPEPGTPDRANPHRALTTAPLPRRVLPQASTL